MRLLPVSLRRTVRTALQGLSRNRMRSALTTLGIVIGIGAVIAMMEIGQGSARTIQQIIANMGVANMMVHPGAAAASGISYGSGTGMSLTPEDCEAILKNCPAVRAAAPVVRTRTQVIYQGRNWVPSYIYGTTPAYLDVRDWKNMADGVPFTDGDVSGSSRVCLLGHTVFRELFQGQSPIGKEIRINNVGFRVVGVLSPKGGNTFGTDQDDIIMAPWTSIKYRVSGRSAGSVNQSAQTGTQTTNTLSNLYPGQVNLYPARSPSDLVNNPMSVRFPNIDEIMAAAHSAVEVPDALAQITKVIRQRHRLTANQSDDFHVHDMTEMSKMLTDTNSTMTGLLLCVACISLVVGGVGIMNIMLVSVTERTREIGLRMAVGARGRDILRQFLFEAVVLCMMGGAIGILLGRGCSILVRSIMRWPTELSLTAIVASVMVSASVGIIFGYYPARKASRLNPIEALRYE